MFYWCISLQTKHGRCWGTCALDSTGGNMSESQRMTSLSHETFLLKVSTVLCWSGLISFNLYPPGWHLTAAFCQNLLMWRKTEIYIVEDLKNFQRSHSLSFFFFFLNYRKNAGCFIPGWRDVCKDHKVLEKTLLMSQTADVVLSHRSVCVSKCLKTWNISFFLLCFNEKTTVWNLFFSKIVIISTLRL